MSDRRREVGQKGEQWAAQYLQQQGYEIVERNLRTKQGEIDLIALDQQMLVFVEVRTRTSTAYGTPGESVNWRKQKKLRELALAYLQRQSRRFPSFRFDVIAITCPARVTNPEQVKIEHVKHAF